MLRSRAFTMVAVVWMCVFMFGMGMAIADCSETTAFDACQETCDFGCGGDCLKVKKTGSDWSGYCESKSCGPITNPFEISC